MSKPSLSLDEHIERRWVQDGDCVVHHLRPDVGVQVTLDGEVVLAHRAVWERANGPIPEGLVVRHSCDRGSCVVLEHMVLGTQGDNMRDKAERGRARNGQGKLTEDDVRAIRASTATNRELSKQYGVRMMHISAIRNHRAWRRVT